MQEKKEHKMFRSLVKLRAYNPTKLEKTESKKQLWKQGKFSNRVIKAFKVGFGIIIEN